MAERKAYLAAAVALAAVVAFNVGAEDSPVVPAEAADIVESTTEPEPEAGPGYRPGRMSTGWLATELVVELHSPSHACRVSKSTTTQTPGGAQVRVYFACPPRNEVP